MTFHSWWFEKKVCIAPDSLSLQVLCGHPTMVSDKVLDHGWRFVWFRGWMCWKAAGQWKKRLPWLFRVHRGWWLKPTQLCGDYFISPWNFRIPIIKEPGYTRIQCNVTSPTCFLKVSLSWKRTRFFERGSVGILMGCDELAIAGKSTIFQ